MNTVFQVRESTGFDIHSSDRVVVTVDNRELAERIASERTMPTQIVQIEVVSSYGEYVLDVKAYEPPVVPSPRYRH